VFIEAIDKLRCVRNHEDSWLVAKFVEMRDRDFWEGELGCPVCEARYMVREGIVYFSPMRPRSTESLTQPDSEEDLFALAAMLDLSAPDRTIVLCDSWTRFAAAISRISEPHVFVVNGASREEKSECIYDVVSDAAIPLAPGSVDAVALGSRASNSMISSAVTVLRDGGRLVATAKIEVPEEIVLLASADDHWVGQKRGSFIPLRRASR
jgi:hypothetical protein